MKILLAVDGSPCSLRAVEQFASRPWPNNSTIKVVTAFELPAPAPPEAWAFPVNYFEELDAALRGHARTILDHALSKLKAKVDKTIALDGAIVAGPPSSVILEEAEKLGADLIVVGSHGHTAWERFLLGSVSQSVVSHAKCSVEIIRVANE